MAFAQVVNVFNMLKVSSRVQNLSKQLFDITFSSRHLNITVLNDDVTIRYGLREKRQILGGYTNAHWNPYGWVLFLGHCSFITNKIQTAVINIIFLRIYITWRFVC